MAKGYFQDITPPSGDSDERPAPPPIRPAPPPPIPEPEEEHDDEEAKSVPIRVDAGEPRGIRSIMPSRSAPRPTRMGADVREGPPMPPMGRAPRPPRGASRTRYFIWGAAGIGVVVLLGLMLLALRPTTVTVTPRSHTIVLSAATPFTAYPATTAASGTLPYTVATADLEDSAVVAASATTTTTASKASGSITVYNAYSASSVKLVKNTRFQTPDGLVFRAPADIVIPGQKGSTPGSVTVTVVADKAGAEYNAGPVSRFSLPGLANNAAMYKGVYAKSTAAMTGGASASSGPGVDPNTLASTVAQLKTNLASKAHDAALAQAGSAGMVLPDLMQVTYTNEPNTSEAGGGVRVHESAHVVIPVFPATALGATVGAAVSADSGNSPATLTPGSGFAAQLSGKNPVLGTDPLQFTLTGQADLVWSVDTGALAEALAGRDQGAFQTIIGTFPGIEEAHARIEPFWKNTFPAKASDIHVTLTAPKSDQ
jgi:hypothetical protein